MDKPLEKMTKRELLEYIATMCVGIRTDVSAIQTAQSPMVGKTFMEVTGPVSNVSCSGGKCICKNDK